MTRPHPKTAPPLEPFLDLVGEPLCTADAQARFTFVTPIWERLLGRPRQELLGRPILDHVHPDDAAFARDVLEGCRAHGEAGEFFTRCPLPQGGYRLLHWRARWVGDRLYASVRDLTEHQLAELTLRERERTLRTLLGNLPGMAYRCANEPRWTMQFVSAGCEELTGHKPEDLVGNAVLAYSDLIEPGDEGQVWEDIQEALKRDGAWTTTYRIRSADGRLKWVWERGVGVRDDSGEIVALEGLIMDDTARREAEQRLAAAAEDWSSTFDAMRDSVAVIDDHTVVRCNAATLALTGLGEDEVIGRRCYEVFHGASQPSPDCPHQRALRSGNAETSTRLEGDRWRRITFQPTRNGDGSVPKGVHVVSDITELKRTEERLVESIERAQVITQGVIGAIAQLVEIRDPYTAGHQRGVSELASAIARHLGLNDDTAEGVRVAGMLHDVGKTSIPAEILIKPGKLSEMEFRLVKGHPQSGYEILRGIQFPWPVALAALQHHERLDGSGYPNGLSDGDILLEARIIAVADVVEAMASHRPYRPALGLEAALAEIQRHRGSLYDARVVDACLAVVHAGFTLT